MQEQTDRYNQVLGEINHRRNELNDRIQRKHAAEQGILDANKIVKKAQLAPGMDLAGGGVAPGSALRINCANLPVKRCHVVLFLAPPSARPYTCDQSQPNDSGGQKRTNEDIRLSFVDVNWAAESSGALALPQAAGC